MIWNSGTTSSNFLYVLGGFEEYSSSNKYSNNIVYFNSGGASNTWTAASSLPQRLSKGAAVVVGNYIYFMGGWTDVESVGTASNKTYFAPINADGSLGSWNTTSNLPDVWWDHRAIEYNGYIYVIGGWNSGGVTNRVLRAKPNADGSLSGWTDMPALPKTIRAAGAARAGNYVFVAGGFDGGNILNTVYYTTIDNSGQMASWQSEDNLPFSHCCGALAEVGGYLYLTGGYINGYTNQVYRAQVTALTPPLPNLNVSDLKQYSPPWNDDVYDQANGWSANPTIERWGCALTSAAMVLQYHGHNTNPDTLNNWLKNQPDGYLRNGLLNWLAVSRYTRLNTSSTSPTLEYRRLNPTTANLAAELTVSRPGILGQPGHFVVGKNQTSDSFGINDPAYTDRPTLASYSNTFLSLGSYRPTQTDLSYLLLAVDSDIQVGITGPDGNPAVFDTYTDGPITDDIDHTSTSGETLHTVYLPTPASGNYQVNVSGTPGSYRLDTYIYDPQGAVVAASASGLLKGETDQFTVTVGGQPQVKPQITVDSVLADLEGAYSLGWVKRPIYNLVKQKLTAAQKLLQKDPTSKPAKYLLLGANTLIRVSPHKFTDSAVSPILRTNLQLLTNSL